jgi:glycogen synthase
MEPDATTVIEVSYEVCNKVGGIYTVVSSKADLLNDKYENYILIGPYFKDKADIEFSPVDVPTEIQPAIDHLSSIGITAHYGKWLIKGNPTVILIEFDSLYSHTNELKKQLWEKFGVDSLSAGHDFDEPLIFSYATALTIEALEQKTPFDSSSMVAHFHEWMTGIGLLVLKQRESPVKTVFTTHATMLGRALCSSGSDLYGMLDSMDPYREAERCNVMPKFTAEKACAQQADVFTTVSEITGIEAEKILGRKPDVLVLNGLDMSHFPTFEDIAIKHRLNRDRMREFLSYYFYPYYSFEMKHMQHYFILGRNEYRNKGVDITISALAKLNERLKEQQSSRQIVCFFFIPMQEHGIKKEVIENKVYYRNIKNFVLRNIGNIEQEMVDTVATDMGWEDYEKFQENFEQTAKRLSISFKRNEDRPPLCTHYLENEDNNEIIRGFKNAGLLNREEDKVKVILYPVYLNGVDGLLDLDYYDTILACHLGLFPSYYEPWGYTPLEAAALGVAALTSDLSGYGRFLNTQETRDESPGVFVLPRFGVSDSEAVDTYTDLLELSAKFTHNQRVENKIAAKHVARLADWKILVNNYIEAHNKALKK